MNVTPGSPADHEHINDGDVIESIGDQSTREMSLAVIRLMLDGKPGSTVDITLVRPGKPDPDKLSLTRANVAMPAMGEQEYENDSIVYLKPGVIYEGAGGRDRGQDQGQQGAQDPAGSARCLGRRRAGQGCGWPTCLSSKARWACWRGRSTPSRLLRPIPGVCITSAPLAVLVNRGTYGPAELAAAAIEDAKRGDVVGERTFGEGSVQKTIDLPDGAALMLTVAKYEGPDGHKIQDEAVTPNVQVESSERRKPGSGAAAQTRKTSRWTRRWRS